MTFTDYVICVMLLLGGIGLFLYGMRILGAALERLAGARLESTLERLTNSRIKGLALGAGVTAVIQSSAATSVMVIGFINAGMMKLVQAVPVIMGANVGTTVTGQILRLNDVSGTGWVSLLNPSSFAPLLIALGAFGLLLLKNQKAKDVCNLVLGFGILFFGMTIMKGAIQSSGIDLGALLIYFKNPILGVLMGAFITALLQSSSASVGVLQTVAVAALSAESGTPLTFSVIAPIIMGMNIGKCVTVLLASIGSGNKAKRAVFIDFSNNIIGVVLFMAVVYGAHALGGLENLWDSAVNAGSIANFHTIFNLVTSVVLLPFMNLLIKLSGHLFRNKSSNKMDEELGRLDEMFLKTPNIALEQCKEVTYSMGDAVQENFEIAVALLENYSEKQKEQLLANEKFLDRAETVTLDYLSKITAMDLTDDGRKLATELLMTITDFEKIGDYCEAIANVAEYNHNEKIILSENGMEDLRHLLSATQSILDMTVAVYRTQDMVAVGRIDPLEDTIDLMVETLKRRHTDRLQAGNCSTQGGISFADILTDSERIASHCSHIGLHLSQRVSNDSSFDAHAHMKNSLEGVTEEYKALCRYYESMYYDPVLKN